MTVIDTGTASGRLALIVLAVAAFAKGKKRPEDVAAFAGDAVKNAEEYIFLDRLAYLAAGGRLSKSGAFFGDMLRMKPVVTPLADGAKKAGLCRSREEQEVFALKTLEKSLAPDEGGFILLEYSDNHDQVEAFSHAVRNRYPRSRVVVHPLSLTSGAHMGPGAWAVAFYRNFPE
jgi:DegV family protein with EDD domain